jgi:hypothetical protein
MQTEPTTYPILVVEPADRDRRTIPAGGYGVTVRLGIKHEAPIILTRSGTSGPTVRFKLNLSLVKALAEAIQKLEAQREVA